MATILRNIGSIELTTYAFVSHLGIFDHYIIFDHCWRSMIQDKRIVAIIPARGGSKSVPGKNLRELGGVPLIGWTIAVAKEVSQIDRIIVSTDDEKIEEIAFMLGAESYRRPSNLATDGALVIDAIRDLELKLKREGEASEIMILLEPTCPFRAADDVRRCIITLVKEKLDSVATFKSAELNPYRAWRLNGHCPEPFIAEADPWKPRQVLPEAYQLNGAVYAFFVNRLPISGSALLFGRAGAIVMPAERSVDIDNELDFIMAEQLLEVRKREK